MSLTIRGKFAVLWSVVPAFQFGWHISALNMIQAVLTCQEIGGDVDPGYVLSKLPLCIPMSNTTFSTVNSTYTVGGLIGSLLASNLMDRFGRKGALTLSSAMFTAGVGLMASASGVTIFALGRFMCGIGAGIGICVVPVMLSEISPPAIRGSIGVLNQLAIVMGILSTQALGMNYAVPGKWRHVLSVSSGISVVHMITRFRLMVESPVYLKFHGKKEEAAIVAGKIWTDAPELGDIRDPLLDDPDQLAAAQEAGEPIEMLNQKAESVMDVIMTMEYRPPLMVVSLIMIAQQISGINAVLYYSTGILSKIMPASAAWISLMITIVNALMTFPAISLIERIGRKALLRLSAFGAIACLFLVGAGLDLGFSWLASIAILGFVASFAIGLGPVPYVIISDVSPARTVGAMSTIALSLNWITNFVVALFFLPLRDFLSRGDSGAGRVFYVFGVAFSLVYFAFTRVYKY